MGAALDPDFERLLNIGQYSSGNPVVARVGLYMEPLVDAIQSGLGVSRAIYNVITWRDPFLSFWATVFLMVLAVFLLLFPWRLFLFATGLAVVGPQNWVIRVMDERRKLPARMQKILDHVKKRSNTKRAAKKKEDTAGRTMDEIAISQPIISCQNSDNSPPKELNPATVDTRTLHQVIVPYSQILSQRFYDWPPEPQYAKCEPCQTSDVEKSLHTGRKPNPAWMRSSSNILVDENGDLDDSDEDEFAYS
jgi:hypothetical protein